jgi:hypothetical protein
LIARNKKAQKAQKENEFCARGARIFRGGRKVSIRAGDARPWYLSGVLPA